MNRATSSRRMPVGIPLGSSRYEHSGQALDKLARANRCSRCITGMMVVTRGERICVNCSHPDYTYGVPMTRAPRPVWSLFPYIGDEAQFEGVPVKVLYSPKLQSLSPAVTIDACPLDCGLPMLRVSQHSQRKKGQTKSMDVFQCSSRHRIKLHVDASGWQ